MGWTGAQAWVGIEQPGPSRHAPVAKAMDYMLKRLDGSAGFLSDGHEICFGSGARGQSLSGEEAFSLTCASGRAQRNEEPMSGLGSSPTLTAHELLRFSIDHMNMSVRHVALHHERVVISLRDQAPQRSLWELEQVGDTVHIRRFPKLRPLDFDDLLAKRLDGSITPELFARIVAAHRPAIVLMVRTTIACLTEGMPSAIGLDEQGVKVLEDRLREIQHVANCLFPSDFPR